MVTVMVGRKKYLNDRLGERLLGLWARLTWLSPPAFNPLYLVALICARLQATQQHRMTRQGFYPRSPCLDGTTEADLMELE